MDSRWILINYMRDRAKVWWNSAWNGWDGSRMRVHFKTHCSLPNHTVKQLGHITKDTCGEARRMKQLVTCCYIPQGEDTPKSLLHPFGECPFFLYGREAKERYAREILQSKR